MTKNFASEVAGKDVNMSWVSRFMARHKDKLISKWSTGMDRNRHQANSYKKYWLYFEELKKKMAEYEILAENCYNMDEKGSMLGTIGRSKRIFSKQMWEAKTVRQPL